MRSKVFKKSKNYISICFIGDKSYKETYLILNQFNLRIRRLYILPYKFFKGEKNFYKGFVEVDGDEYSIGNVFLDGGTGIIKFKCPKCNWVNTSEEFYIPNPPAGSGESLMDMQSDDGIGVICSRCNNEYHFRIHSGFQGLSIISENLPNDWKFFVKVKENYEDDENS